MIIKTNNFFILAKFAFGSITNLVLNIIINFTYGFIIISSFETIIGRISFIIINSKTIFFIINRLK